tara:strand:+ start:47 stop:190 length:144 start_codon:yes stop_codon:yes gene_type:complete
MVIEVIIKTLEGAADLEINLGSESGRKFLAEKIKIALDRADNNDRME